MQLFGSNTPAIVQYLLAFVIVLGVLAVFAAVLRRITGNRPRLGFTSSSARHRQQRLGVIDAVDIDAHRQLLLLRRDNVEHLVLIGGPNDLLVESGIGRLPYRAPIQTQQGVPVGGQASDTARLDPPAPPAGAGLAGIAGAAPVVRAGLDPVAGPELAPSRAPRPVQPPQVPPPRSLATTPVAPNFAGQEEAFPASSSDVRADDPDTAAVAADDAAASEPPPARVREPAKGPFSAVARQLEEALRRPFAAVRPAPVTGIDLDDVAPPAARGPGDRGPADGDSAAKDLAARDTSLKDTSTKDSPAKDTSFKDTLFKDLVAEKPVTEPGAASVPAAGAVDGDRDLRHRPVDTGPVGGRPVGSGAGAGPVVTPPPPPPPQARLPVPPPAAVREAGGVPGRGHEPSAAAEVGSLAQILPPTGGRSPHEAVPPLTPSTARPAEAAGEGASGETGGDDTGLDDTGRDEADRDEAAVSRALPAAGSAGFTPRGTRIIGPSESADQADTLKVPEALKTSPDAGGQPAAKEPFDLSSLENIEAEFARLLGRVPPGKDK